MLHIVLLWLLDMLLQGYIIVDNCSNFYYIFFHEITEMFSIK